MVDFDYFLAQKYANQKTQADSEAALRTAQAGVVGADSAARNAALTSNAKATMLDATSTAPLRAAQAASTNALIAPTVAQMGAQTGLLGEQTLTSSEMRDVNHMILPDLLHQQAYQRLFPNYNITNKGAAAGGATPNTDAVTKPALPTVTYGSPPPYGTSTSKSILDVDPLTGKPKYMAKGSANVKGPGDGTVDTIPSMLANGEAVLNKGGAETLGRDTIKHLNLIGAMKMGMVGKDGKRPAGGSKGTSGGKTPAKGQQAVQHHAMGTERVTGSPRTGGNNTSLTTPQYAPLPVQVLTNGVPDDLATMHVNTMNQFGRPAPTQTPVQGFAMGTELVTPQPLISSGGGTGAAAMAGGTTTPVMMMGMPVQNAPTVADLFGLPSPTPQTATPVRYATGHSNVGKGKKSDTPKPTDANVRMAVKALGNLGMAKKPLPKGFGRPGMV